MPESPVILVSGLGRCGSSMVCQMLAAAGLDVAGEYPAFEPRQARPTCFDGRWIAEQHGRVVKVLDPQAPMVRLRPGAYRIILITRNSRQQARSMVKLQQTFGGIMPGPVGSRQIRALAAGIRRDGPKAVRHLQRFGPVQRLRFEDIVEFPSIAAGVLASFTGLPSSVIPLMAHMVAPRGTDCLPYMLEFEQHRAWMKATGAGRG